ncbi:dimethylarginine dimethylaminohydrolase family protein [Vibrio quintilis]|uniref:Inosamine-phosphate amidinotransferase 1 n=1 Tax=Vibrio quintilis TaxID=1117707 RepID=A0A1M7Z1T5_9VIBR|nr:amidinotransferase [Vibrio quintilis]SHO58755.1 Inosamine-phosphate amidinotransferase 1 [Vibrio quintilis]
MSSSDTIYVESEFAPLRRVILAESEFGFPEAPLPDDELAFLPPESQALFGIRTGGDHCTLYPERHNCWLAERENFSQLLQRYGIEVLKPRQLFPAEKQAMKQQGYSNFFVRDPIFTIGSFVIEGAMRFAHRRHEVLPVRSVVQQAVMPGDCHYLAVPQPELYASSGQTAAAGPYLEGGDILVLGKHILVGSSGLASGTSGKNWLEKLLAPHGYTVELVPLKETILHLDCALSLVKNGLMIVCESALLHGLPEILKDWDRINITEADCARLAANGLPLNEETYVIDPVFEDIGNALAGFGTHVETIDFTVSRSFGGSFRCSTQPLLRSAETI